MNLVSQDEEEIGAWLLVVCDMSFSLRSGILYDLPELTLFKPPPPLIDILEEDEDLLEDEVDDEWDDVLYRFSTADFLFGTMMGGL